MEKFRKMTEKYYIHEDGIETRESIALLCIANELAQLNQVLKKWRDLEK